MVDSNVKVAIRVRPMNQNEVDLKAECVVHMEGKKTVLKSRSPTYEGSCTSQKEFLFDHSFWSVNDEGPAKYTSQEDIFETLGKDLIDSIFAGFNSCIFAYGQTGSGKTFSMMGTDDQPGLVPRICSALFSRDISHLKSFQVEATYLEIYNEKVRDLLYPTSDFRTLKVREQKSLGPYVEGLSHHVVRNTEDIKSLINEGNKCRKIASTKMNEQSSRSHAIFTLAVTQTLQNERGAMKEFLSKVSLMDLAGSERTSISGATGDRMKESNNINKSLTSLGLVINSLAELSQGKRKSSYVNYRDSKLTWLLKNNLGGNSKTVMLATISSASVHYQETLSTLNYANSAKRIVNKATVNEDIKSKAIDELKDEVRSLREQLQQAEEKHKQELEAKLNESEKLLQELKVSWEEKLKTETSAQERHTHLQRLGITVENIGIRVDEDKCYLLNLSPGISNQKELFLYYLGEITKIGADDSQDIRITRPGTELEHCVIDINQDGEVFLTPNKNAETFVNGLQVQTVVMLSHEDKIKVGNEASFTLHKPNIKLNTTPKCANAVHNVPSNQSEEGNKQGNKSIDEECDTSLRSDNIQWSSKESTDCSVSKCPYSNASGSMDSSGHGFLDVSQNISIVSPEISDTTHLEDQESCDRNKTTIETMISPKNHREKERNSQLNVFDKNITIDKDDTIHIQNQVSKDDKMYFSNNPTSQTVREQNISSENQTSTDDKRDISMNPTYQIETKQNVCSQNKISDDDDDDDRTNVSINNQADSSITPTSPSVDPSIEDNLISRPENIPGNYTSQGHTGVSIGVASSEEAANYIRRLRREIMATLQRDFNDWLDELDSQNIITKDEYFTVDKISDTKDKARALVNIILQKDESACRAFLQCLKLNQDQMSPMEVEEISHEREQSAANSIQEDNDLKQQNKDHGLGKRPKCTQEAPRTSRCSPLQSDRTENFQKLVEQLNMKKQLEAKLTLGDVLKIDNHLIDQPQDIQDIPWHFLTKIIGLNRTARNIQLQKQSSKEESDDDSKMFFSVNELEDPSCSIHPLDVLCVFLHCSDLLLQQEIITKMSMCQFAVPLLVPLGDGSGCTFMLWAMRDIVKKWRPQSLTDSKGFREGNVVNIEMPIFSFIRLGPNKLSKSKLLNQVLNPAQQHHDFFIHDNMEGGNIERKISDGLVEMSWYFPCGKSDVFSEPIAVANLRGDLESNWEQFTFLTRISSAIFIFVESMCERQLRLLSSCDPNDTKFYFLVTPGPGKDVDSETQKLLQKLMVTLKVCKKQFIVKRTKANDAEYVQKIQNSIDQILKEHHKKSSLENVKSQRYGIHIDVDEDFLECQKAREYALNITSVIQNVDEYKKKALNLQGDLWKKLSKIEKELCRMTNLEGKDVQQYQDELIEQHNSLHKKQYEHDLSEGMMLFISAITQLSQDERQYFLKWMKLELEAISRSNVSALQAEYKEKCGNKSNNLEELKQIDQKISDSSLGIEHFLRELGQFYEAECSMIKQRLLLEHRIQFAGLPKIASDLLLDGFPLELIDGDASNISLQWITDVLTELDKKTGGQCRMRVITVLGVQSTGKSTILNTMFGLQFPVASGRCTRGAFMTLLKVKENFKEEIGCEFILVIDTEGLKAPELASLENSYEHDNELATLVVGLSDITIVNMAMENTTEMKDILQMVVHAFLRMKEIGKKPNCQFVHQNVSDVSAHDKNRRDRKKLLEQLNEMTKVAATMEQKTGIKSFCDVMNYDPERHNWYIPGLWHGVPPMAPVNFGYSENVYKLKQDLLTSMKTQNAPYNIPDFITWVESLWNAVKHEKCIFSFRNSLVAEAYGKLSTQFSLWEWEFQKKVNKWINITENKIKNQVAECLDNETYDRYMGDLQQLLLEGETEILKQLENYFDNKTENVHLVERYREDFRMSVISLKKEMERKAISKYEKAVSLQKGKSEVQNIQNKSQRIIEEKITELVEAGRYEEEKMTDQEIKLAFEKMWEETMSNVQIGRIKQRNVNQVMLQHIKSILSSKGSAINQMLVEITQLYDQSVFKVDKKHIDQSWLSLKSTWHNIKSWFNSDPYIPLQELADSLIEMCDIYITEKMNSDEDYDDTYCLELLQMINKTLRQKDVTKLHFSSQFELEIILFIFSKAARVFQGMHNRFVQKNDPRNCLELKPQYFSTFLNMFKEKDESQSRTKQFCEQCLTPAITQYVFSHLGERIVDDILHSSDNKIFSTRTFFQFTMLENLLVEMSFQNYLQYLGSYKTFSKKWIINYISKQYNNPLSLENCHENILSVICDEIQSVLQSESCVRSRNISQFFTILCENLRKELVIPQNELKVIVFGNTSDVGQFSLDIQSFLTDTKEQILSELMSMSLEFVLSRVTLKPQDELLKKVIGCGHQCPFCKVPCEAGGADHKEHFASVHRPRGLGGYSWEDSNKLVLDICTTAVVSDTRFRNSDTEGKWHPYKEYRTYYPDWSIQPDPSIESSDYWKYIFARYNKEFSDEYNAKPADLPPTWTEITKDQALLSLKKIFNVLI